MSVENIEEDHFPDVVENNGGIARLEALGIKEKLRDPTERRAFFAEMTNDQYRLMFGYVNALTRGMTAKHAHDAYEDGELPLPEDATPPLEDKEKLMELLFNTAREIAQDQNLDAPLALRRIGLTLSGGINFIHPKLNGNGRSGRIMHYIAEFGTERGDQAFNEELYAIIAKTKVYDSDADAALYDTPPPELTTALGRRAAALGGESYKLLNNRERAAARVAVFLDMMRGRTHISIDEDVSRLRGSPVRGDVYIETIPSGTIGGAELYEREYVAMSAIPKRTPTEIPPGAQRVLTRREKSEGQMRIEIDLV
jgi:hypothetical protein